MPVYKEYPGPTFGLRARGVRVLEDPSLAPGTLATVRRGQTVYVNPSHGLTEDIAEHEAEHLAQNARWGPLANAIHNVQYLISYLRGQDPTRETAWERTAYQRQDRARRRFWAEQEARMQQMRLERRRQQAKQ